MNTPTQLFDIAAEYDANDPLLRFRQYFHIPTVHGSDAVYLCGNSLGLLPKTTASLVAHELENWAKLGVFGHHEAPSYWSEYHRRLTPGLAQLVGAKEQEVVAMNNLTTNLHLMMVSFYQPRGKRIKILCEGGAFPSDQYAFESQIKFHGLAHEEALVELWPREGEKHLRTEDILNAITTTGDELALVLLSGVQYYSGQLFDMAAITKAGRSVGAYVGFDLAHAIGNVELKLHEWGCDFAVWCGYKYLNSGPGGMAGAFVHERHANNPTLPRFAGWWGHDETERFLMKKGFKPMAGAEGWQLANANVLSMACQIASLQLYEQAGFANLRAKSAALTHFLELALLANLQDHVKIITPAAPHRGAQLSLVVTGGKKVFDRITKMGVIADWREPDVIRIAPVPLYNTFMDIARFVNIMQDALKQ